MSLFTTPVIVSPPPRPTSARRPATGPAPRPKLARPIILLVDDDPSVRESLRRVLVTAGVDVVTAASGEDALACLQGLRPDLVITDLCMAAVSGWDLLFHEHFEHPDVPFFVVTALPPKATAGADQFATAYFQKPLDLDALLAAVRRQVGLEPPLVTAKMQSNPSL